MKYFYSLLLLIGFCSITAAQNPIVIEKSNFNVSTVCDSLIGNPTPFSFNPVQQGANLTWDFSNIQRGQTYIYGLVGNITQKYPNCALYSKDDFEYITATRGFKFDSYYEINDNDFAVAGRNVLPQSYFIGDLSGNQNDSLSFPGGEYPFENPYVFLKFPATYQSSIEIKTKISVDFVLTVTNFGIIKAPGKKTTYYSGKDTIVGWGKLILPNEKGTNTEHNVLQLKRQLKLTDSIFLNGAPAPQAMMSAFGLTQGKAVEYNRLMFWEPNNKCYLMRISYPDNNFEAPSAYLFYMDMNATGIDEQSQVQICPVNPNPVVDGMINLNVPAAEGLRFELCDMLGASILRESLNSGASVHSLRLPDGTAAGIYFYRVVNQANETVYSGKLTVGN